MNTTDPQSELLTEVDKNNKVIGPIERGIAHNSPNKYYRTVSIFIKNGQSKYLWQKRSSSKDLYPDCWDFSVGGHVEYGDSYIDTTVRELKEELSIKAKSSELKLIGKILVRLPMSNEHFHVYEYCLKPDDKLKIKKKEIVETRWMTIDDVKKSMQKNMLKWYARPIQIVDGLF